MGFVQKEPKKIVIGWPISNPRLPSAYQEVEYIESSWTQFIETDVNSLTAPFKVEVKYMKQNTDTSDQTLVWQRQLWKFVNIYNNYYENLWSDTASWSASGDNDIHTIITDSSNGLYKDWVLLVSWTSWNRSSSYNALIFAFSEDSAANAKWFLKGRIYEVKIISNNALYRHYIPCYRKSDGVIGMYEIVAGVFKTNSWSWTFTKWGDISPVIYREASVYVWTERVRPPVKDVYLDYLVVGAGWSWWNSNSIATPWWWGWAWWYVLCTNQFFNKWDYCICVWVSNQWASCYCPWMNWWCSAICVVWVCRVAEASWWWWGGWGCRSSEWVWCSWANGWWWGCCCAWGSAYGFWKWFAWWAGCGRSWWGWGWPWWAGCQCSTFAYWWSWWNWKGFEIYWTTYCIWWWGGGWGCCSPWYWKNWWWRWGYYASWTWVKNWCNATTYCWAWGWGADGAMGWLWTNWIVKIWYPANCGYTVSWGTKYECNGYCVHDFTSNSTLNVS